MKEMITYDEFVTVDAAANLKKWWADRRAEHVKDGCPLDRGAAGCVICEVPKVIHITNTTEGPIS